jgi:dual specificity protein kinase YAK1
MASKNVPTYINGYNTHNFLGRGSFANVFRCSKEGNNYAMKRINSEERFKKYALREIDFLNEVDNPYIVKMVDNFMEKDIQYLVFEFLKVNLYKHMFKNNHFPNFKKFAKYSFQISDGLAYLHAKNIVHCDLKLENIMVNDLDNLKIIDLGSSMKSNTSIKKKNLYIQSRYYRAPEILYEVGFSNKIDIWSMGIILTEMILRKCVFNGKDSKGMIYKIADFIGIPELGVYTHSIHYDKLFEMKNDKLCYRPGGNLYNVKGYREDRLEEYLINGLRTNFDDICDYQIDNTVGFIHKILNYDFNMRLSAAECKNELLLLENEFE